ncbi:CsiV family protein [Colwellia echini]|uniref:Peptidoglycan-binding protein, CsiV n=1 Tax=Colwellia echini TaxID=1982103 RepID=A0ABY3MUK8_9GAMM|nr:CsiV family protein [Colwellia echini]TYK64811.1 hypothetical protein CWS31_013390 [Colwellia echini]
MKYNLINASNLPFKRRFTSTTLASLVTSTLASFCLFSGQSVFAADNDTEEGNGRWFEIEIILFKHVNTNSSEKPEQFTPNNLTDKKKNAFDLLTPYIQPNIATLKQLLPSCEQSHPALPYNISLAPFSLDNPVDENSDVNSPDSLSESSTEALINNDSTLRNVSSNNYANETIHSAVNSENANMSVSIISTSFKEKSQALLDINEQSQTANQPLTIYTQYPSHYISQSQTPLCIIPTATITQNLTVEQLESFNVDSFPIEEFKTTVDGLEQWQADETDEIIWASNTPYLISEDSLQLKSIANRIKRSRNYQSLLHFGWRQIGEDRRQAKAIKVFAGENLDLHYQEAITQQKLNSETVNKDAVKEGSAQGTTVLSIEEQKIEQVKQQQLNHIFEQFSLLTDTDTETAANTEQVKRLVAELTYAIDEPNQNLITNNTVNNTTSITPPPQPWMLDGLFKVHLDHYLYINTEFNIAEKKHTLVKTTNNNFTNKSNSDNSQYEIASFKQDRRVITGEIHYFDHPSMGMVVQIRRFDPTKPAAEAVTQAKK